MATYTASSAEQTAAPEVIVTRAVLATAAAEPTRADGGTDDRLLLAVAYEFAPDCEDRYGRVRVVKLRPYRDLQIGNCQQRSESDPDQRPDVDPLRRHDRC